MVDIFGANRRPLPSFALLTFVLTRLAAGHVAHDLRTHARSIEVLPPALDSRSSNFVGFSMFTNGTLSGLGLESACESALYQTVDCDAATSTLMTNGYVGSFDNATLAASVCDSGCGSSLAQLRDNVASSCGEAAELIDGLPFLGLVDMLRSNWNQSCFYDPDTGDNCNGESLTTPPLVVLTA